ncbi:MAG: hypothetical protein MJ093_01080 [Saccharofermentans sp.]|nr:hypothetical protein [Saccharofermentans sp.]
MRYFLIINSRSNPRRLAGIDDAINEVSQFDSDLRSRIELRYTQYGGHACEIAAEIAETYGDKAAVVVCGGDGSVHEVANTLAFTKTPLICIPFGTGNDFAKSVLPPRKKWKTEYLLKQLDSVTYRKIDMVKIDSFNIMGSHNRSWSAFSNNVASIGLDTKVQAQAKAIVLAKNNKFNRSTAYIRSALKCIFGKRSSNFVYRVELEDGSLYESTSSSHTLISICNASYYGNGFMPAPNAKLDDGLADVCVIDDVSLLRALYLVTLYKFGKHEGHKGVHCFKVTSGTVTSCEPSTQLMGNYDGEDFFGNRIRFEVNSGALTLGFFPESVANNG